MWLKSFILIVSLTCIIFVYWLNGAPLKEMPLPPISSQIGQMIMVGFNGTTSSDTEVRQLCQYIKEEKIGGVLFYDYNILSPEQTKSLIHTFQNCHLEKELFIAIDQEGGFVQRLKKQKGFAYFHSSAYLANTKTASEAFHDYIRMATLLHELGFNLNFGTVLDLNINPNSPAIGALERSYSKDPDVVVKYAEKMILAHRQENIITAVKHFPGHGSAIANSHHRITNITDTWQHIELKPYQKLLEKDLIDMIMTAHILHTRIDPFSPASLSQKHIRQTLRELLRYDGVIITDDLLMGAIKKSYNLDDAIVKAVNSEIDILLFASMTYNNENIIEKVHQTLNQAIQSGIIPRYRIENAYKRIHLLKEKL